MQLNNLKNTEKKQRKRVGRGNASGHGTYSGKGLKGQKSRSGFSLVPGFEGGQLRLIKKLAKLKGFKNHNRIINQTVTLDQIDQLPKDADVNIKTLLEAGIIDNPNRPVKILNVGKLTSKRKIQISKISTTAKNAIIKSGSEIIE
ncbi:MAG: 50S ribosomal protein L15 [Chloroflexi bacterium]|nr:50S ribosomal protein L15 [Chloroflexota bacterium]|tara:strand:+ start:493 stop:927 length:435 start_codon:yes stop_codon:yes gene_type:complete